MNDPLKFSWDDLRIIKAIGQTGARCLLRIRNTHSACGLNLQQEIRMNAMYANPMVMPLAVYRFWLGMLYAPAAKATAAGTEEAMAQIANAPKQLDHAGRRLRYVSARVHKARQNALRDL
jgi:hypothetical protein